MKITILLIAILLTLISKMLKERFTQDANINTFLNTWHTTNDELQNMMELKDDSIDFSKKINANNGLNVNGKLNANNGLNVNGNLSTKNIRVHGAHYIRVGNESGGNENNWIKKNRLAIGGVEINRDHLTNLKNNLKTNEICIGGTCINENHLKVLTGKRTFILDLHGKGHLDGGAKHHNKRIAYINGTTVNDWTKRWRIKHGHNVNV